MELAPPNSNNETECPTHGVSRVGYCELYLAWFTGQSYHP
jgi:hypothetical protein